MKILPIDNEDKAYFQQFYKNHNVIGLLEEDTITRVIIKSKNRAGCWTPFGTARDCGKYYIIAKYSNYVKIDKETLKVLDNNAEDR